MSTHSSLFLGYKIIKSNKIIQAKSSFSFIEHRIILLAMARIQPTDTRLKMYSINIRDVLGSVHTSNYHIVRSALERLHKSVISIEEGKLWKSYSFITKAQGEYGSSYISIQFHEDIQKFLLGLKSQYTSYVLKNVIKFRRNYSLRIYELCKQYEKMGSREFDISYLRNIFSLKEKYKSVNLFKIKVIEKSIEEINSYSDLFLTYEDIKCGRKIEKIKFFIKKNDLVVNDQTILSEPKVIEDNEPINDCERKLFYAGFSSDEVQCLLEKYGLKKITEVVSLCDEQIENIKFPKAWIRRLLRSEITEKKLCKEFFVKERQSKRSVLENNLKINDIRYLIEKTENTIKRLKTVGFSKFEKEISYKNRRVEDVIGDFKKSVKEMKMKLCSLSK